MTKMMEIMDVISEGYGEYYVEVTKVESVEEFIKTKKDELFGEGEWFLSELKDGWFSYGYEGSEYEGMFKVVVSEEEKNKFMNMNGDELFDFVDSTWK
jgi:hypothetical protein